jgi:hypothetical protein
MLFNLLGGRSRLHFICQTTAPALIILITTVSCSGPPPNLPEPISDIVQLFTGTETPKQQLVQQDAAQPKDRRPAPKKASTAPKSEKTEQQLYKEFLEWKSRQRNQP